MNVTQDREAWAYRCQVQGEDGEVQTVLITVRWSTEKPNVTMESIAQAAACEEHMRTEKMMRDPQSGQVRRMKFIGISAELVTDDNATDAPAEPAAA